MNIEHEMIETIDEMLDCYYDVGEIYCITSSPVHSFWEDYIEGIFIDSNLIEIAVTNIKIDELAQEVILFYENNSEDDYKLYKGVMGVDCLEYLTALRNL